MQVWNISEDYNKINIEFKESKIINSIVDYKFKYLFTNTGKRIECWSLLSKKKIDFPILDRLIEVQCSKITDLITLSKNGKFIFIT